MTEDNMQQRGDSGIDRRGFVRTTGIASAGLAASSGTALGQIDWFPWSSGSTVTSSDHTIESWDGTEITTTFYTPGESGPNPTILMTHGWGGNRSAPGSRAEHYAENGYNVLTYDSRGFGDSGGVVRLNGPKEVKDARTLIDWLAKRNEVELEATDNPRLGMDGRSYAGGIQPLVAHSDDRVDAIVPRITWNDLVYSLGPHGVVKSGWLRALIGVGEFGTWDLDSETKLDPRLYDWWEQAKAANEPAGGVIEAGKKRSIAYRDSLDVPTLSFQGWDDALFKPNEAVWTDRKVQDSGAESRIAFHKGGHAPSMIAVSDSSRTKMNDMSVTWMDRHLKGEDVDVARASVYSKQEGSWFTEDQWPPADTTTETYELGAASLDGSESLEAWFGWFETDATYSWTMGQDVELLGTPQFDLSVEVPGETAHLFMELQRNGSKINTGEVYRFEGAGSHRAQFEFPTLQRSFAQGDTLDLYFQISTPYYFDAEGNKNITIDSSESRIHVPQRPK